MDTWSVNVKVFEEMVQNVDMFQGEKGLWGWWLVNQVTRLLRRCKAVINFGQNYMGRRFRWWLLYAMTKKHILAKVEQQGWVENLGDRLMKMIVVRCWRQGWQATVAAARLMELVRRECGQLLIAITEWGHTARFYVQLAYCFLYRLLDYEMRYRLRVWKDKKKKKTLFFSGSLVKDSTAAKLLDLVEHGSSVAGAAWKLVESGENEDIVREVGMQLRLNRKQ